MAVKKITEIIEKASLLPAILLLSGLFILSGCTGGTVNPTPTTEYAGGKMSYIDNPLPNWTAGKFNSALLQAKGGQPPYTWTLKEGSQMPEGFQLYTDGKLTGTPPLLSPGTTKFITPPFTIIITDTPGQSILVNLSVTIEQPEEPVYNINVIIDPPGSGTVTKSLSPDPAGYHKDDMVMLTAEPAEGMSFLEWYTEDIPMTYNTDTTMRFNMPDKDITFTAHFKDRSPQVYTGDITGTLGSFSASNGCRWEEGVSGTITLTIIDSGKGTDGGFTIGTVEFYADLWSVAVEEPYNTTCTTGYRSQQFGGDVTGTYDSFGGFYQDTQERPLQIKFTAKRNYDTIACTLELTKVMQVSVDGVVESYPELTATIPDILLTANQ